VDGGQQAGTLPSTVYCLLSVLRGFCECQAHRPACPALQLAVRRPCVSHEVLACPRIPGEELHREHRAFQLVAVEAGGHEVPRRVVASSRERNHMIERRRLQSQRRCAVDAAAAAISEGGTLDVAFLVGNAAIVTAGQTTGRTGQREAVDAPMRHCTSPEKTTPRTGTGIPSGA